MKKYNIIYADPPWNYDDKSKHRGGAERHYGTMTVSELMNMDVNSVAAEDCVLLLWATFPNLPAALSVIEAWGFKYKTIGFNWVKRNKIADSWFWGMGNWTRSNSEVCLLAVKGNPKRVAKNIHSVLDSRISKHSKKPDIVREKIVDLCGDLPRLEMFARQAAEGWDAFGNEVSGSVDIPMNNGRKPIVIIESPYAGNIEKNIRYARDAMADSIRRGEAPYASHLLYTQDGVLRDDIPEERREGIKAGLAFSAVAEKAVFYTDLGTSSGIKEGLKRHRKNGLKIERRTLEGWK